jgi:hypothetical protein
VASGTFCARKGTALRLGEDRVLIAGDGFAVEVDGYLAQVWESFDRFRTIPQQQEVLQRRGWEVQSSLVEAVEQLEKSRLLVRGDELTGKLKSPGTSEVPAPRIAAWLTRGRPGMAARSIASFVAACGPDFAGEIRVFDDTPDGSDRNRLSEELRKAGAPAGPLQRLLYAHRAAAGHFREELCTRAAISPGLASFALEGLGDEGWRCGAARNVVLLSSVGERFLFSDDDTHFGFRKPATSNDSAWRITASFDPLDAGFPTPEEIRRMARAARNPVEAHAVLLGKPLGAGFAFGEPDLGDLTVDLTEELLHGSARVAVTMAGTAGHSGMENSRMVLGARGRTREALFRSADGYSRARLSRSCVRTAASWTVSGGELLVAPSIGLDNSLFLPPFPPVGRNAEGIFSMVLRKVDPGALIGHLPCAVIHDPGPLPPFSPESLHDLTPRLPELMTLLLVHAPPLYGDSRDQRLAQLGRYFAAVAGQSTTDFDSHLRGLWLRQMEGYVGFLDALLARHRGESAEWESDVEAHLRAVGERASGACSMAPRDLGDPHTAMETARRVIGLYGELLVAWPAIRRAAGEIGPCLFTPLAS